MDTERDGFTMVELVVVMAVIAVLLAIGFPTFMGIADAASDRSAQADVRAVLLAERALWLDAETYTADAGLITDFSPGAQVAADPADGVFVDLHDADDTIVCLVRLSESGRVFSVWEHATAGTYFGETDLSAADCPAALPDGYAQGGW